VLFDPADPLGPQFRTAVEDTLGAVLARHRAAVVADAPGLGAVVDLLTPLVVQGKHVRPAFLWWAYVAVAGEPADPASLLRLAASLDLTHAGLLAHDDLIDAAEFRRGRASTHRAVAALSPVPNAGLGVAGAVIGGSWLLQWASQAFDECGLELSSASRAAFHSMRSRVLTGQMADALAAAGLPLAEPGVDPVALIDELKTASYTVVGPVALGALAAGGDEHRLAAFAAPLGRAYQARDDVLGVFGREELTGKPTGDDLRLGKLTALVQSALALAAPGDAATLRAVLGDASADDESIARATAVIERCGAREAVEASIASDLERALAGLDRAQLDPAGRIGLTVLARACVDRDR